MANEEQLSILKQGVDVWNKWRKQNPKQKIDLTDGNLEQANLLGALLGEADLSRANLKKAYLARTYLVGANLSEADLSEARLLQTGLNEACLCRAKLFGAWLIAPDIWTTDLSEADLQQAYFYRNYFDGAKFFQATVGDTTWVFSDFSKALQLDSVKHTSPSSVDIETINMSKGCIPDNFLRGCGFTDLNLEHAKLAAPNLNSEQVTDITYKIHQLYLGGGIRYYSCFISYSSKDQEFAQRLHDDLQDNGVRCWFDREDLKIGDAIRPTVDRQIRLRDKLLVILSENSIKSEWVGDEVEGALEEEQKGNRSVLFPIRLDDTVLNTRDDWAAKIKRRRHIGDFSNWRDKSSYQKSFARLLRDLKATE